MRSEWAIEQQVANFDRKVLELARHDLQVRKFMTAPGVGPITALCFKATMLQCSRYQHAAQ
jgi:transposase